MTDETAPAPRRFKTEDEWTVDEILEADRAEKAGQPAPRFERPTADESIDPEAMSVDDHLQAIREDRP